MIVVRVPRTISRVICLCVVGVCVGVVFSTRTYTWRLRKDIEFQSYRSTIVPGEMPTVNLSFPGRKPQAGRKIIDSQYHLFSGDVRQSQVFFRKYSRYHYMVQYINECGTLRFTE
jgi:hypothetical protein